MKLAIFGASGKTGRPLVEQALAAGHTVTALVRNPAKLGISHGNLRVITGDATDPAAVRSAITGNEVVLSALGPVGGDPDGVLTTSARHIIECMRALGLRRLIALSSLGVGDSRNQVPFMFKVVFTVVPVLRRSMADHNRMDALVRASGLDFTLVRAGGLRDEPRRGSYKASTSPTLMADFLPRADVAAFMLDQVTDKEFIRQAPGVI